LLPPTPSAWTANAIWSSSPPVLHSAVKNAPGLAPQRARARIVYIRWERRFQTAS
jgi:hypothetical protein